MNLIACTHLLDKELHRHTEVGRMMTSGSLGGERVSTLARNTRDVGSISALTAVFPIFIASMTIDLHMEWWAIHFTPRPSMVGTSKNISNIRSNTLHPLILQLDRLYRFSRSKAITVYASGI